MLKIRHIRAMDSAKVTERQLFDACWFRWKHRVTIQALGQRTKNSSPSQPRALDEQNSARRRRHRAPTTVNNTQNYLIVMT